MGSNIVGHNEAQFLLQVELNKTHPKNKVHAIEGLLPDNAGIDMYLGIVPKNIEDFDKNFWSLGHLNTRTDYYKVNDIPLILGYYSSPYEKEHLVRALFKISPKVQLQIRVNFENTDPECVSEYCTQTTKEMLQILSTFKFTN